MFNSSISEIRHCSFFRYGILLTSNEVGVDGIISENRYERVNFTIRLKRNGNWVVRERQLTKTRINEK